MTAFVSAVQCGTWALAAVSSQLRASVDVPKSEELKKKVVGSVLTRTGYAQTTSTHTGTLLLQQYYYY